MTDNAPVYNMKAVMHEVGLSAATLRAWERRYQLLKPSRTPGGHRLYTKQDIEMLKWLVARQNEGLSISQAIEMWKSLKQGIPDGTLQSTPFQIEISPDKTMIDMLRDQWINACLAFNESAANKTLDQAFAIVTPEMVCIEVLQKGMVHIGEGWYSGENSVQQEHFATAIAKRRINNLIAAIAPPSRSGHILAACPPGEEHDFILLLCTYLLSRAGWDVIYLGPNVPLNELDATVRTTKPVLVISAAQTLESAASLAGMSEYLVEQGVPLAYGGGIFTQVTEATLGISGFYLGVNLSMLTQSIEVLIHTRSAMPIALPLSPQYAHTLYQFRHNAVLIDNYVVSMLRLGEIEQLHMEIATSALSRMISSALVLGNIAFLDHPIAWLNGLLKYRGFSTTAAMKFYSAYHRAVANYLGDEGTIILDWLAKVQFTD